MNQAELNDLYDYDMYIYQNSKYFKFSVDSVLLAEFVRVRKNAKNVLDLCSGNAPIPLILSKKFGDRLKIDAYELQPEIYELGKMSIEKNNVRNINYYNDDIKNIDSKKKYDIVTCNPPYFIYHDDKVLNDNEVLAKARHEISTNLDEVVHVSAASLKNGGYFYLVHTSSRIVDIIECLKKYNFGIKSIVPIYDNRNGESSLVLIEALLNGKDYVKIKRPVYIDENKTYQGIFGR